MLMFTIPCVAPFPVVGVILLGGDSSGKMICVLTAHLMFWFKRKNREIPYINHLNQASLEQFPPQTPELYDLF